MKERGGSRGNSDNPRGRWGHWHLALVVQWVVPCWPLGKVTMLATIGAVGIATAIRPVHSRCPAVLLGGGLFGDDC